MSPLLTLEIAVPDRQVVNEKTSQAQLPLSTGYKGVLPGHAPMMAEIGVGVLTFTTDKGDRHLALNGGVVEILPEHIRILAATAEFAPEIDRERAVRALERANQRLQLANLEIDAARAQRAIARARARLAASDIDSN